MYFKCSSSLLLLRYSQLSLNWIKYAPGDSLKKQLKSTQFPKNLHTESCFPSTMISNRMWLNIKTLFHTFSWSFLFKCCSTAALFWLPPWNLKCLNQCRSFAFRSYVMFLLGSIRSFPNIQWTLSMYRCESFSISGEFSLNIALNISSFSLIFLSSDSKILNVIPPLPVFNFHYFLWHFFQL